jgi:FkbH-like protein
MTLDEIARLIDKGELHRGLAALRKLIGGATSRAQFRALAQFSCLVEKHEAFAKRRVQIAVGGQLLTENLRDSIAIQCLRAGLVCSQKHTPFGQLRQEIRNPQSVLYLPGTHITLLLPNIASYLDAGRYSEAAAIAVVDAVAQEVGIVRQQTDSLIVLGNFLPPESRPTGILDWKQESGVANFYRTLNLALSQRLASETGVLVVDLPCLAMSASLRWTTLTNEFFLSSAALPDAMTLVLGRDLAAAAAALLGVNRKCLVVDIDNTIWHGIIGEDGTAGIKIGGSYPGNVYLELQRQILSLYDRGVILAINSKNNESDVWDAFDNRPEMLMKRHHFSAWRINWQDKASNLRELASDLNIGLDSVVMLDDNPLEREWIESSLPEVYAANADDPLSMVRFLSECRLFDTLNLSAEDAFRNKSYAAATARKKHHEESSDLNSFLETLEVMVEVRNLSPQVLGRFSQLTQKTNQFNLTTRRYSEKQVVSLLENPRSELLYCSCRDRFADEGIVGAAVIAKEQEVWSIDTFLLSCRVLGRGVEQAFMAAIYDRAKAAGALLLRGEFIRTTKNGQTEFFYEQLGFALESSTGDRKVWVLRLDTGTIAWPQWIRKERAVAG